MPAQGIWIDSFSECYLKALSKFYSRGYDELKKLIAELERNPLVSDRNNENKLWILKARVSKALGDSARAREAYGNLLSDPVFEREAEKNL